MSNEWPSTGEIELVAGEVPVDLPDLGLRINPRGRVSVSVDRARNSVDLARERAARRVGVRVVRPEAIRQPGAVEVPRPTLPRAPVVPWMGVEPARPGDRTQEELLGLGREILAELRALRAELRVASLTGSPASLPPILRAPAEEIPSGFSSVEPPLFIPSVRLPEEGAVVHGVQAETSPDDGTLMDAARALKSARKRRPPEGAGGSSRE